MKVFNENASGCNLMPICCWPVDCMILVLFFRQNQNALISQTKIWDPDCSSSIHFTYYFIQSIEKPGCLLCVSHCMEKMGSYTELVYITDKSAALCQALSHGHHILI